MAYKFDIFPGLAAMDRHDLRYLDRLPPEEAKGFAYPVALRFASAVTQCDRATQDWYILAVNDRANVDHQPLWDYPDLQFRLMASCGLNRRVKHEWIGNQKKSSGGKALTAFLETQWPDANAAEIDLLINQFDEASLGNLLRQSGVSDADYKDIMDDYDRLTNKDVPKKRKRRS